MMQLEEELSEIDQSIFDCLDLQEPKSFFLFAGAGSGKTRSLVTVLKKFKQKNAEKLKIQGQKVAIITYTNAACEEIKRRLDFDSSFIVSTIHSFSWDLINPFQKDIKKWVKEDTIEKLSELEELQKKGRSGTKAEISRAKQIESKQNRLKRLPEIKRFTYNPNGINESKDSLNHSEVIKMASVFMNEYPLMQLMLISKYPILLIDESQDTKKELIEAFFLLQQNHKNKFTLGLFGDTMQRIYNDGKEDLGNKEKLPKDWLTPEKKTNYRCPKRVLQLINKIRSNVDSHLQDPWKHSIEGVIRLFIINSNTVLDKAVIEKNISHTMAKISEDTEWKNLENIKILTLEHHMAASRGGFLEFFQPLYSIDKYKTGLLDGSLSSIVFLTKQVLPLVRAKLFKNEYLVVQILKKHSPLLLPDKLKEQKDPLNELKKVNVAVSDLLSLWKNGEDPLLIDVVNKIKELNLFVIPNILDSTISAINGDIIEPEEVSEADEEENLMINAWKASLSCTFSQLDVYNSYISDNSQFGTHQGVKGLEFPRVMVILDDDGANGFLFSYEKLLGAKPLSPQDISNKNDGRDNTLDRTRRLFYVACSRAEQSLAIIAYTSNPEAVKRQALNENWFSEEEIIEL